MTGIGFEIARLAKLICLSKEVDFNAYMPILAKANQYWVIETGKMCQFGMLI